MYYVFVCVCVRACLGEEARVCVSARVALLIQHVTRRHVIRYLSAPPNSPRLYHKRHDFRKPVTEHGVWGSVMIKALRYKSMGLGIDPRWFQ
jgi:hypothetical protein